MFKLGRFWHKNPEQNKANHRDHAQNPIGDYVASRKVERNHEHKFAENKKVNKHVGENGVKRLGSEFEQEHVSR